MYADSSPVISKGSLTPIDVLRAYPTAHRPIYFSSFVYELYRLCLATGINFDIAIAKAAEETSGFTSDEWSRNGNPAGIGVVTGGAHEDVPRFTDGIVAARIYAVHLAAYIYGATPTPLDGYKDLDTRWTHVERANYLGSVSKIGDFGNGRWADNPGDARNILRELRSLGAEPAGETGMSFSTSLPGLPGGPLVTDYPIRQNILPPSMTRNRPGIKAKTPRRSVQHGNGNPNSTAAGEARYLRGGAEGRQASYHAAGDDKELWVMIPLDEVTWQAADGGGHGNMNGLSCEMVEDAFLWDSDTRKRRCIHICADFMGRCAARFGIAIPEQHWTFNYGVCGCTQYCETHCGDRHDCPNKLRNTTIGGRPAWELYAAEWHRAKLDELKRMGKGETEYAKPMPIDWKKHPYTDSVGNVWLTLPRSMSRWEAQDEALRLQYGEEGSPVVGPPVAKGTVITAKGMVVTPDHGGYLLSSTGTRLELELFVPKK
jgi:hypothetical protein